MHIKIGSRGSKLALWQSEYVSKRITDAFPHVTCEIVIIKTKEIRFKMSPYRK